MRINKNDSALFLNRKNCDYLAILTPILRAEFISGLKYRRKVERFPKKRIL